MTNSRSKIYSAADSIFFSLFQATLAAPPALLSKPTTSSEPCIAKFYSALDLDDKKVVIFALMFLLGCFGAYVNYYYELSKNFSTKITVKMMFKHWFHLLNWCVFGGVISLLVASPAKWPAAFFSGFALLAILEQFKLGRQQTQFTEEYVEDITKKTIDQSQKELEEALKKLK